MPTRTQSGIHGAIGVREQFSKVADPHHGFHRRIRTCGGVAASGIVAVSPTSLLAFNTRLKCVCARTGAVPAGLAPISHLTQR